MKRFITLILLVCPLPAFACTMLLSWTPPTMREDGRPLLRGEIKQYILRCNALIGDGKLVRYAKGTASGYKITSSKVPAGRYSCIAVTKDINGLISLPSKPAEGFCK